MPTANKGLEQPANNSSNWDVPLNANFGVIDSALGAATSISVSGIGTSPVTLTSAQYQCMSIKFSGTLSNNVTYRVPINVGGMWVIQNNTSGSFSLTIGSGGGGTSVAVTQGTVQTVYSDGTNIVAITTASGGGGGGGGSNTQVIYNSLGTLTGSANMTFDGSKMTIAGLSVTGQSQLAVGSAALPALAQAADPNTGLYFPTSDTIALATNGTERFTINSVGAVAIAGSYGTSGQYLRSNGSASAPSWVTVSSSVYNQVGTGTTTASLASLTVNVSSLSGYKFLTIVFRGFKHNSGSDQSFRLNGFDITDVVPSAATMNGILQVSLSDGVVSGSSGRSTGSSNNKANAFLSTISTATTGIVFQPSASTFQASGVVTIYASS